MDSGKNVSFIIVIIYQTFFFILKRQRFWSLYYVLFPIIYLFFHYNINEYKKNTLNDLIHYRKFYHFTPNYNFFILIFSGNKARLIPLPLE